MNRFFRLLLLLAAACGLWTLSSSAPRPRPAALVVEESDAAALCAVSGYPLEDFRERARAAGAWGLALRSRTLEEATRSNGLLHFSRADVEKMRRLGLIAARSPLQGGSVWSKDAAELALVDRVLERRGFSSRKAVMGGQRGLLFAEDLPASLRVGYDRAAAAGARSAGLVPVFVAEDDADAEAVAAAAGEGPAALLVASSYRGPVPAVVRGGAWAALPPRSARGLGRADRLSWARSAGAAGAQALTFAEMDAGLGPAALRRRLSLDGADLVLLRLDPELGLERSFERLRSLAAVLRGLETSEPGPGGGLERTATALERLLLWGLLLLLAAVGPMFALRRGLDAARALSRVAPAPASPLLETAGGAFAAAACMLPFGAGMRVLSASRSWRLGLCPPGLEAAALLCVLLLGAAALYPADPRRWLPRGGRFARWGLFSVGLAAAALLLWKGRSAEPPFARLGLLRPGWDWLVLRWPELLLGQSALFAGCWFFLSQDRDGAGGEEDPFRGTLLLGLLALTLLGLSFLQREGFALLCTRAVLAAALGIPLGLFYVGLRRE
ncbi:MAG: hypothetical protein WC969_12490 [Elusimicrobiota bacterium]|jgi:hypothetical protein